MISRRFLPLLVLAAALLLPAIAQARPTAKFLRTHTSVRMYHMRVDGHRVRVCRWRQGDPLVRVGVDYNKTHLQTIPRWADAASRLSRAVCALNGGTYSNTLVPSGVLWSHGRVINNVGTGPAVGFLGSRVIFGADTARRLHAPNIMNGMAFLIRKGVPIRSHADAPWTTPAQFNCGARGTDSWYGCYRSVIVQFTTGRVALVEVELASLLETTHILQLMHVTEAITFDAGGAAEQWMLAGRHNCGAPDLAGHCFGSTVGTIWHRHTPDATVLSVARP